MYICIFSCRAVVPQATYWCMFEYKGPPCRTVVLGLRLGLPTKSLCLASVKLRTSSNSLLEIVWFAFPHLLGGRNWLQYQIDFVSYFSDCCDQQKQPRGEYQVREVTVASAGGHVAWGAESNEYKHTST